jgi:CHAT domain-containing protein
MRLPACIPAAPLRLVGAAATEARVRAALPEAGLMHFAAHAVVDGARPLDAYVQLAHADGAGQDGHDDGRLAAWEVLSELTIDAELVTLSACRTARGRTLGGDGVLGLSQAFQLAGAEAVLATLWDVPDRPTAELIEVFYQVLADGHDAASALRAAQLDMLARQRARADAGIWSRLGRFLRGDRRGDAGPYEWAAFKLDGRTG